MRRSPGCARRRRSAQLGSSAGRASSAPALLLPLPRQLFHWHPLRVAHGQVDADARRLCSRRARTGGSVRRSSRTRA
eukprot:1361767-Rhodomonas_salina.2